MDITLQEILDYMATNNENIFPMQYIAHVLGFIIILLAFKPSKLSSRIISGILAFLCLWVGLVFGLPIALQGELMGIITAIIFTIQGCLFSYFAVKPKFLYGFTAAPFTIIGLIFI